MMIEEVGEVIFENKTLYTKKLLTECNMALQKKPRYIILVCVGTMLLLNAWLIIESFLFDVAELRWVFLWESLLPYLLADICVFGGLVFILLQPRRLAGRNIRSYEKAFSQQQVVHWQFGDRIVACDRRGQSEIEYRNITKVLFTKHLCILIAEKQFAYCLSIDGFTKGTYPEFVAFLQTKCPYVKFF